MKQHMETMIIFRCYHWLGDQTNDGGTSLHERNGPNNCPHTIDIRRAPRLPQPDLFHGHLLLQLNSSLPPLAHVRHGSDGRLPMASHWSRVWRCKPRPAQTQCLQTRCMTIVVYVRVDGFLYCPSIQLAMAPPDGPCRTKPFNSSALASRA